MGGWGGGGHGFCIHRGWPRGMVLEAKVTVRIPSLPREFQDI